MTHDLLTRMEGILCHGCNGDGVLGKTRDGRYMACEICGGHEDSAGTGIDTDGAAAIIRAAMALIRGLREVERAAREREAEDARFDGQPEEKRRAWHLGDVMGRFEARLKLQDALLALAALDKKGE